MSTSGVADAVGGSTGALDDGTSRCQGEPSCSGSASRGLDLDDHGFAFHLWSYKEQPPLQVGDDVFVSLRSDKDTGKAKLLQDAITEPGHQYKGRYKVEFYDGTGFYHVRRGKMIKVLHAEQQRLVVIVGETDDMRVMARTQLEATDRVVDIGSSFGICTDILSKYCRNNVIGIEISSDAIKGAQERYPHLEFIRLDALEERDRVKDVCKGANKLFLDLGGNRPMESIISLLPFLERETTANLIVVKNRELGKWAAKHIQDCSGDSSCKAEAGPIPHVKSWWENLKLHYSEIKQEREKRAPRGYHQHNLDGAAPVRFTKYPLHYKHRENPQGVFICRYHNYGVCSQGEGGSCPFDHGHCHHCGQPGHIAKNCTVGLNQAGPKRPRDEETAGGDAAATGAVTSDA